jgi:hypothetical protein
MYMLLRWLLHLLTFALLTLLTQIGGIPYLLSLGFRGLVAKRISARAVLMLANVGVFLALYAACSLLLVPPLARRYGRVPLPLLVEQLQPLTAWTWALNRHYVRPELRELTLRAAAAQAAAYPGTLTLYLDANFPFFVTI